MRRTWVCVIASLTLGALALKGHAAAETQVGSVPGKPTSHEIDPKRQAKALELLGRARATMGNQANPDDLRVIAGVYARLGQITEADKIALSILPIEKQWEALQTIAENQAESGDIPAAKQRLVLLKKAIADFMVRHGGELPKDRVSKRLAGVAVSQAGIGDAAGAKETLKEIEKSADRAELLANVALAEMKVGLSTEGQADFASAIKIIQASNDEFRLFDLPDIARLQREAGDPVGGRKTLHLLKDPWDCARELSLFADTQATSDHAAAKETLADARKVMQDANGEPVGNHPSKALALLYFAGVELKTGDDSEAKKALAEAIQETTGLDNYYMTETMEQIAVLQEKLRDPDSAKKSRQLVDSQLDTLDNKYDQKARQMWVLAIIVAADNPARSRELVAKAVAATTDWKLAFYMPLRPAQDMAEAEGPNADLNWIEKLPNDQAKACAYAGAARGMLVENK